MTVIYLDELFLLNFVVDYLLLLAAGRLCGEVLRRGWLALGAAVGAGYAAAAFLPVYDNLERALKQETADEAFKKGVEMTMTQLKEILAKLGIEEIPALGETFDPNLHNAVMHVEDESAGENTIVDVFQAGFKSGDKVIRFAMVKVAN